MISMRNDLKTPDGKRIWNVYKCTDCEEAGIAHTVDDLPDGHTGRESCWGVGIPKTKLTCSNCGAFSGPWVSSKYTGDGW